MNSAAFLTYAKDCGCDDTSLQGAAFAVALWFLLDGALSRPSIEGAAKIVRRSERDERVEVVVEGRAIMTLIMKACGEPFSTLLWPGVVSLDSTRFSVVADDLTWAALVKATKDPATKHTVRRIEDAVKANS